MYSRANTPVPVEALSDRDITHLKKQAKRMKKESPALSHHEALNVIARQNNSPTWKALQKRNSLDSACELIHGQSITLIFDRKDYLSFEESANDESWWQSSEGYREWLMPALYQRYLASAKEDEADWAENYDEFCENNWDEPIFPSFIPRTQKEVEQFLRNVMAHSYFVPDAILYKGEWVDMYAEEKSDLAIWILKAMNATVNRG